MLLASACDTNQSHIKTAEQYTYSLQFAPAEDASLLSNSLFLECKKAALVSLGKLDSHELIAGDPSPLGVCLELSTKQLSFPLSSRSGVLHELFGVPVPSDSRSIMV